jgi:hypothetical protein
MCRVFEPIGDKRKIDEGDKQRIRLVESREDAASRLDMLSLPH